MNIFDKVFEKIADTGKDLTRDAEVRKWVNEIGEAVKREKDYLNEGERCVGIYEMAKGGPTTAHYNILFANTETLAPAIFATLPRPLVKRKYKDPNPIAEQGARVLNAVLDYQVKADEEGYSDFKTLMDSAVREALVPGRGAVRFRYDAEIEEGDAGVKEEMICGDEVPWNRILMGYGKVWKKVPWVAFEHFLTREECVATFGEKLGNDIKLDATPKEDGDKGNRMPKDAQGARFAHIYEIWDKQTKKVKFVSESMPSLIKQIDDPLGLENFFPMPEPLQFMKGISSQIPKPLYLFYEEQAKELNLITARISALIRMLKVRGVYDSTLSDIAEVLKKEDGFLVPATNVAALQQGATLEKSIWLMPIDKLVAVIQQLYTNRQQVKSVIYEITGIADIMRGSSQASETLGAQEIKQQWGTLRLKTAQGQAAQFVVRGLRIQAEIACNKFSIDTFKNMTGISLPMEAEKQQAMQVLQMAQQAQQQAAAMPPPQAMPGQPPQPPAPPPGMPPQPMIDQAQKIMQTPSWEEVTAFLKDELHREYSIDIETDSTLDAEMSADKQDVTEFVAAMGQLMQGMIPLAEKGILPFDMLKAITLAVVQKFRFGIEIEEQIKEMQAPKLPQPGQNPKDAAEAARIQQEMQFSAQVHEADMAARQQDMAQKAELGKMEMEFKGKEHQFKLAELAQKSQAITQKAQMEGVVKSAEVQATLEGIHRDGQVADATAAAAHAVADRKAHDAAHPPAAGGSK